MYVVPTEFRHGPFTRAEALRAGITPRVLEGSQFVRLHHEIYRHRSHPQCFEDDLRAARLALPDGARTTGITRIQELGLDAGPRAPLHFVLEGDHHLTLSGVFLHRTVSMPPEDGVGVSAEAAFVAYCAEARTIDAIRVGSAGLPEPAVNAPILLEDGHEVTPDLWFEDRRCVVEYEGGQHQEDRAQYTGDIDRYAAYRREGIGYELVTRELMRNPRSTVRRIHRLLVEGGYDGPGPSYGELWVTLFRRLTDVVRPRPHHRGA
jgi:hypothetical protein